MDNFFYGLSGWTIALSLLALTTQTAPTSAQSPEDPATESPSTGPVVEANAPTAEPEVEAATPVEEDTAEASPPTAESSEPPVETVAIDVQALPDVPPAELVPECAPGMRGCFLDIRDTWRSFDHEYARLLHVPEVHYGIAAAEELAFVGIGCVLLVAQLVFELVMVIRASLAARDGRSFQYPVTMRLV